MSENLAFPSPAEKGISSKSRWIILKKLENPCNKILKNSLNNNLEEEEIQNYGPLKKSRL